MTRNSVSHLEPYAPEFREMILGRPGRRRNATWVPSSDPVELVVVECLGDAFGSAADGMASTGAKPAEAPEWGSEC